jgi:glucosamine--fructose-6-phosphate aminotransferase (isomerizing)
MNSSETKYSRYALCREMLESAVIVANYDFGEATPFAKAIEQTKNILITGEGSSRIFPAKHFRNQLLTNGIDFNVVIEGALQAMEYNLDEYVVFGLSNSGKTKELVGLFSKLKKENHPSFYGITATPGTPVSKLPKSAIILTCGKEEAVAATKSVMEQALFFDSLLNNAFHIPMPSMLEVSNKISDALSTTIDPEIIRRMSKAPVIYFAGRNDGVAEELTLKTNEITRKKSAFLEGTYALHGIEEVMNKGEILIVIDPFEQEEEKFNEILVKGAGVEVIAISTRPTLFPTILIPDGSTFKNYIELAAGWNLLVETGLNLVIDLDKPVRARKIGNEDRRFSNRF